MSHRLPAQHPGLVLLQSLVVLASVGVIVVLSLSTSSIQSVTTSRAALLGPQARQIATACVEEGLDWLRQSPGPASGGSTFSVGSCTYVTTEQSTGAYRIVATGTVEDAVARLQLEISSVTPTLAIESWQDIP